MVPLIRLTLPMMRRSGLVPVGSAVGTYARKPRLVDGMGDVLLPGVRISPVRVNPDNRGDRRSRRMKIALE